MMRNIIKFPFDGRITRTEFIVGACIELALLFAISGIIFAIIGDAAAAYTRDNMPWWMYVIAAVFGLHQFSLSSRRLHDIGVTGYVSLALLFPYVMPLLFIFLFITPSQKRDNSHGPAIAQKIRPIRKWLVGNNDPASRLVEGNGEGPMYSS